MNRHPYDDGGGHSAKAMFSARDAARCLPLCLCLLGAACTGSPGAVPIYFESEPNDDFLSANLLGTVYPGEQLFIRGDISASYPDPADGFAVLAAVDCDVEIILRADPGGADLDLHVYDPVRDEFVFSFQSPFDPERGYFGVLGPRTEFHLVVTSASVASNYELELRCHDPTYAVSENAGPIVPLPRQGLPVEPAPRVQPRLDAYRLLEPSDVLESGSSLGSAFWVEIDATGEVRSGPLLSARRGLVMLP